MEVKSLKELFVVLQNGRCFKEIMEHTDGIKRLLNIEGIERQCLNLERYLREYKLVNSLPWSPRCDRGQAILHTRDDILHRLSILWKLYHVLVAKQKENLCPSLYSFCWSLCDEGSILQMLVRILKSDDHFITFQAYKVLLEIVRRFSEVFELVAFRKLISTCLSDKKGNGRWTVMYIFEIFKEMIIFKTSQKNLNSKQEKSQSYSRNCDCKFKDQSRATIKIDFERIWSIFYPYWLDLNNHCFGKLFFVTETEINLNSQSEFQALQQTLASYLSLLLVLLKSYFQQATAQIHRSEYLNETCQTSLEQKCVSGSESYIESDSHLNPFKKNSKETQCKVAETSKHKLHPECTLSIMECIQATVVKLVEINKKEFSLYLRRNIMQFINEVTGLNNQFSFTFLQNDLQHGLQISLASICNFLLENMNKLFESIPKIKHDVHFGGQDVEDVSNQEVGLDNLVYDRVTTRKVLLLILRSMMITLQVLKRCKSPDWKLLIDSVESWVIFLGKAIPELCERSSGDNNEKVAVRLILLFGDQDDELMTVLLYLLNFYQELVLDESLLSDTELTKHVYNNLNAHRFFLEFLCFMHYDHSLLLDFLISNETCFLQYFSSYLRYLANDWNGFLEIVNILTEQSNKSKQNVLGTESNCHSVDVPDCSQTRHEKCGSSKTVLSENCSAAFQDSGYKSQNYITILERNPKLELSSEKDSYLMKNIKKTTENVSIPNHSALWSLKDDYGDQISSDSDSGDRESDMNGTSWRDDVFETDRKDKHADDYSGCYGDLCDDHHENHCGDSNNDYDHYGDDGHNHDHDDYPDDEVDVPHDGIHDIHHVDYRKDGDSDHHDDVGDNDDDDNYNDEYKRGCHGNHDGYNYGDHDGDDDDNEGQEKEYSDYTGDNCDMSDDCNHMQDDGLRDYDHNYQSDSDHNNDCDRNSDDADNSNDNNDYASDGVDGNVSITGSTNDDQDGAFSPSSHPKGLHKTLSCLIRLRFSIERMTSKQLFPYPVEALIRLIKYIESLYEGE